MRGFSRGAQRSFGFCFPVKRRQGLTTLLPEARDDKFVRQVGGGRDQPICDGERQARLTTGQGQVGAGSPDEPLPDGLHSGIRFKRGVENGFSQYVVLLKKMGKGKKSRGNAKPVPRADFARKSQRLLKMLPCLWKREQI